MTFTCNLQRSVLLAVVLCANAVVDAATIVYEITAYANVTDVINDIEVSDVLGAFLDFNGDHYSVYEPAEVMRGLELEGDNWRGRELSQSERFAMKRHGAGTERRLAAKECPTDCTGTPTGFVECREMGCSSSFASTSIDRRMLVATEGTDEVEQIALDDAQIAATEAAMSDIAKASCRGDPDCNIIVKITEFENWGDFTLAPTSGPY